jgi:diacylglycerol kinase (ATP)
MKRHKENEMNDKRLRVCIIANPVSGVNRTALEQIQAYTAAHPALDVTFHTTLTGGDAKRFAQEAAASGADIVAAYGGDGTVMEVADGLRGTDVPMLILPGGTANVMALELGIALDLDQSLALLDDPTRTVRIVDMGQVDSESFLLRVGIGYEAEATAATARSEKSKAGRVAYWKNALRKMRGLRPTKYKITIDGVLHIHSGITCMICNSSNIGMPGLKLVTETDVSDGLLDVIVIDSMQPGSILRVLVNVLAGALPVKSPPKLIAHWQGREVTIETKHRQLVARDGELMKRAKRVSARVLPGALHVIVPAAAVPVTAPTQELKDAGIADTNTAAV